MTLEQVKAVVIGHAVADALGVPMEFSSRKSREVDPVREMRGYGTYSMPAGSWSDDTSMSLCALDAMREGECDFYAIMENFVKWYQEDAYTPTGKLFDIGGTCSAAISNFIYPKLPPVFCGPVTEQSNGNGALMRIHPFVLYALMRDKTLTDDGVALVFDGSTLTHGHRRSQLGCGIYAFVLAALLHRPDKASVREALAAAQRYFASEPELVHYERILKGDPAAIPPESIRGSGYVVHSLEAALWCLLTTDSYRACVLQAVNLGEDTDTTAAIVGGLAGALYGYDSIPEEWRSTLIKREEIEKMCDSFYHGCAMKFGN